MKLLNPIEVTFTKEEIDHAVSFIDKLTKDKAKNKVYDAKFDRNNTSYSVNLMGYLGELAAAKVLGIKTDTEIRTHGDEGFDLKLNSKTIQVKTSTLPELIFNRLNLFTADVGMLVQFQGDRTRPHINSVYHVIGYIKKEDFLKSYYTKNYGYGDRFVIGLSKLSSIEDLMLDV
ncbi:hypothetical protein UFOVP359_99 [uncultured Caudovirales phage]|jgi:hypothetical protein|uniref:Uncharacterized protein n=1 Tax=uncultured Caudovirales phage TaxID=2100421 RepID=A0A6J7WYC6_9CAUD|nr:hypothetical protein UFOVP359_99 [uncultured Caudovirales phage]